MARACNNPTRLSACGFRQITALQGGKTERKTEAGWARLMCPPGLPSNLCLPFLVRSVIRRRSVTLNRVETDVCPLFYFIFYPSWFAPGATEPRRETERQDPGILKSIWVIKPHQKDIQNIPNQWDRRQLLHCKLHLLSNEVIVKIFSQKIKTFITI